MSIDAIGTYLHNLHAVQPDFVQRVARLCWELPDDVPAHPLQTSFDVASLAPNAEITVIPWEVPVRQVVVRWRHAVNTALDVEGGIDPPSPPRWRTVHEQVLPVRRTCDAHVHSMAAQSQRRLTS